MLKVTIVVFHGTLRSVIAGNQDVALGGFKHYRREIDNSVKVCFVTAYDVYYQRISQTMSTNRRALFYTKTNFNQGLGKYDKFNSIESKVSLEKRTASPRHYHQLNRLFPFPNLLGYIPLRINLSFKYSYNIVKKCQFTG